MAYLYIRGTYYIGPCKRRDWYCIVYHVDKWTESLLVILHGSFGWYSEVAVPDYISGNDIVLIFWYSAYRNIPFLDLLVLLLLIGNICIGDGKEWLKWVCILDFNRW